MINKLCIPTFLCTKVSEMWKAKYYSLPHGIITQKKQKPKDILEYKTPESVQSKTWLVRSYGLFSSLSTSDSHSSAPRLWLRSLSLQISISISLSSFFFFQWIILLGLYIYCKMILYGDYSIFCFCNLIRFCYYCYCSCFGMRACAWVDRKSVV